MWCWSDENAACSRCHAEQDNNNHKWTKRDTHFQEVGELRVCGREARSGGNMNRCLQQTTISDHAIGQCKAKRWSAVNFGKAKLAAMAMVNLAREISRESEGKTRLPKMADGYRNELISLLL